MYSNLTSCGDPFQCVLRGDLVSFCKGNPCAALLITVLDNVRSCYEYGECPPKEETMDLRFLWGSLFGAFSMDDIALALEYLESAGVVKMTPNDEVGLSYLFEIHLEVVEAFIMERMRRKVKKK